MMHTTRKWLFYTLYTLFLLILFLCYLFPSEEIRKYLVARVRAVNPDYELIIRSIRPAFPPGLALDSVGLLKKETPLVRTDRVKLMPKPLSFIGPAPGISFRIDAYGGKITGEAAFARAGDAEDLPPDPVSAEADLSDIVLASVTALRSLSPHPVSGTLSGHVVYKGDGVRGVAEADLTVSDGKIELKTPLFAGVNQLAFTDIQASLSLHDNQNLRIRAFTAKGSQISGEISGTVILKQPRERSLLNLKGEIRPHPSFLSELGPLASLLFKKKGGKGAFPFKLTGTVEQPNFSLQ